MGSLGAAVEEDSFRETDSEEFSPILQLSTNVIAESKNGRVKWQNRGEVEVVIVSKEV